MWMSLILILVLLCDYGCWIFWMREEYIPWILEGVWDFGYPHLYTLYPLRIAVNTS